MKNLNTNPAQLLRSIVLLTTMSALAVCPCAFGKSGRPLTERRSNLVASITDNTLTSKWGINALSRESDYIVNCSYTQYTANHNGISADSDAYGAINDVHINNRGADWVKPGEGAEGVIGLMAAARQMHGMNLPTTTYDAVLDIYFDKWIYKHRQGWQLNPSVPNYGGMADRSHDIGHRHDDQRDVEKVRVSAVRGQGGRSETLAYSFVASGETGRRLHLPQLRSCDTDDSRK